MSVDTYAAPILPRPARSWREVSGDYLSLTKPRLSSLVMLTAAGGMWLAQRSLDAKTWICAMVGTAGIVGAANAINCVIERDSDRFMARTSRRPLPTGRLHPTHALRFAWVLSLLSLPVLTYGVNWLTGLLGAVSLWLYAFVYTPMKSRTSWAMYVGAIPGALPPLMGWTAATGRIEAPAVALFSILFFWQLPHFIAIALFRKAEYQAAGLTSLPLEKGDEAARFYAVLYTALTVLVSLLPFATGVAGPYYLVLALVLGVIFLGVAWHGWQKKLGTLWARQFFFTSLVYLTVLFIALAIGA